ncbi:MAG: tRNA (adenosine(37)-N6)-threonylcarbamoyltransferase complex dimerization subunit type 1 TsaB [Pseudomonadota bacterium]
MSVVLAIDTSRDDCALACTVLPPGASDPSADIELGDVAEDTRSIPRRHNEQVLGMLDELLSRALIAPREIDAIVFAAGPGSFTGIRIAAAISQAIAVAADAVILRIGSSRHLAYTVAQRVQTEPGASFWTALYSRQDSFYAARYERGAAGLTCTQSDWLMRAGELRDIADGVIYSDQAAHARPRGQQSGSPGKEQPVAPDFLVARPRIRDLLALGCADYLAGLGLSASAAIPLYVDGDTPWHKRS